jgi:tetratricopeptide (TPR) repeat protein
MPQLSALQWIIVVVFQAFYGFAVFALTKDYYERQQAVQAVMQSTGNHGKASPRARAAAPERELPPIVPPPEAGGSVIPEAMVQQDPVLLAQLGDERFRQRQYSDAIGIYRRVLEMAPDDTDTYNDLGLALYYSGDSAEALRVLKEGAEKDPGFQRIWLTLGFVQMHTDERGEARFALQQAIELGGDDEVGAEASRILESLANAK